MHSALASVEVWETDRAEAVAAAQETAARYMAAPRGAFL